MRNHQHKLLLLLATTLLFLAGNSAAENAMDYGDFVVHYNAFTTDSLTPQVARNYGITRSKNRALLNITVLKKVMGTTGQPVTARVKASATNLTGQFRNLDIREVREGTAIYYVSEFRVSDRETLAFSVDIRPMNAGKPHKLTFRQQFFTR